MDRNRTVNSSHEYFDNAIVDPDKAEDSRSAPLLKYDSDSDGNVHLRSMRMKLCSVLQKNKILQALSRIYKNEAKKNAASHLPQALQDEEDKPDSFRFIVTVNRLAKLILIYFNNSIWKYIGVDILPAMHEYRDAWVDLLKALIKSIKLPRRYTCFLNLLPKAVAQDLASIFKNLRQDLLREEILSIRSILRGLWRSSEWQYSKLSPELDGFALQETCNANIRAEDDLLICLANIQHFAPLFACRSNPIYAGKESCTSDSPINMHIERVKEILFKMGEARRLWAEKLEIEAHSFDSLDYD